MKRIVAFLVSLLLILSICGVTASAAASPTPKVYYSITVGIKGYGNVETDKTYVVAGEDDVVTLTAQAAPDKPFQGWEITGTFEPVEGDELSTTLKIRPTSDIIAVGVFLGGENDEAVLSTPSEKSPTSPQTGQSATPIYIALALMTISAGGVMLASRKLRRKQ